MKSTILKMMFAAVYLSSSLFASGQHVVLSWTAPAAPPCGPITAYNIYRADTAGGEVMGSHIGAVGGVAPLPTTFSDNTVAFGHTYFYKATAYAQCNTPNQESVFSNEVQAIVPVQVILIQPPTQLPAQVVIP